MGVSDFAKMVAVVYLVSTVLAVPTGDKKGRFEDSERDLEAESSEVISHAVAAPLRKDGAHGEFKDHSIEMLEDSQNFFPSFANLFEPRQNNYRFGFGPDGAYSQRPNSYKTLLNYPLFGNYRSLDSFGKQSTAQQQSASLVDSSSSILGSGNFGVIRGGTFFAQNEEDDEDYNDNFSYYNNGHGRPSVGLGYVANPRPNYNQDQFANFRDFADINTPANSAYSHFVVVYANKNATQEEVSEETKKVISEPKNIFEALELLDKTEVEEETKPPPKISKAKAKLAATKLKVQNKKYQWNKSKEPSHKQEIEEPLLALS